MSRSSFFSRSSRDSNPLLPQYSRDASFSLQDLSPREDRSRSSAASPSPPPSFYRDNNNANPHQLSPSPSPSRTKARKIQFAAPPPPIATSVLLLSSQPVKQAPSFSSSRWAGESSSSHIPGNRSASPQIRRASAPTDPLLGLERRERAIQQELQLLLDAQSAGLVQGFGGDAAPDGSSDAGSSTPTSRSVLRDSSRNGRSKGGIVPVRQPKRKPLGLRGARRGLLKDMGELVGIKKEEVELLMSEIEKRNEVLGQVEVWEKRIEGAREQLSGYSANGDQGEGGGELAMELAELGTEERAVENEIREMEDRLAQMKARRAWLKEQIREGINRQEAKLSSYRGALREAESEVKQFLKRPPLYISAVMGDEEGFMALPSNRRTSGMAREWWTKELSQLRTRKQEVEKERSALEDGAKMWQDSIQVVNEFEDDLRKQMTSGESQGSEMLKKQIDKMKEAIEKLQKTADVAEERGWNLLICAVGAELEAFKEGQKILESALEMIEPRTEEHEEHDDDETHTNNSSLLNELNEAQKETESVKSVEREDSEDDGPNLAELLVDKGHEDDTS